MSQIKECWGIIRFYMQYSALLFVYECKRDYLQLLTVIKCFGYNIS